MAGIAGPSPDELADDLEPLFDAIVKEVSPPAVQVRWGEGDGMRAALGRSGHSASTGGAGSAAARR
jgi:hypothetical protein